MESHRIRETFLSFFEERDHRRVASASLIPPPESGLLLTNAGMNQFIPYFLGQADPPFLRAVTSQKCFRANDIDNVGHTARHLTMFEMLGNFSFGDYFKADAIPWAHGLITEGFGIDHDLLWVTVYEDDAEATELWIDAAGLAPERIVRRGRVDVEGQLANYWHTHAAGPGGPCSEIFVDHGARYGPEGGPDVDEDRFMEIWNLVFIQDQVDSHLEIVGELPAKNIDTGASLERVATFLQGVDNVFETDVFVPLLEVAESLSGKRHGSDDRDDISLKVIAEHGRATSFLIADGVQPSNEGRGYILRRMLRRVVSHARRLGVEGGVMEPLVRRTVELMGDVYPELRENEAFVLQVATSEEERFAATLRQGLQLFERASADNRDTGRLAGEDAFKLSDTFGFPLQLTQELAADAGLDVDVDRFAELLEEQRRRARASAKKVPIGIDAGAVPPSEFVGYRSLQAEGRIVAMLDSESRELPIAEEGEEVQLFLDVTPFYAEGGGQIGDHGTIRTETGSIRVVDAQWAGPHAILHTGIVESRRGARATRMRTASSTPVAGRPPPAPIRPRTSSTGRSSICWANTRARPARSSHLVGSASTSRIRRPCPRRSSRRRRRRRTAAWRSTMRSGSTRRRSTRRRRRERSRSSARSTATWSAWSRSGSTRESSAVERTCGEPGTSR